MLIASVSFDIVGVSTYSIPLFGEFFDLIWAPISAILMWLIYRNTFGAIAGLFSFLEEILPGMDIIPSFTIMWFVKYYYLEKQLAEEVTVQ